MAAKDQTQLAVTGEILFQMWDTWPRDRGMQAIWIPEVQGGVWDGLLVIITHVETRDPWRKVDTFLCENRNEAIIKVAEEWQGLS